MATPAPLQDFNLQRVTVSSTGDDAIVSGLLPGSRVEGMIGTYVEPLIATFGVAAAYAGSKDTARSNLDLAIGSELALKIDQIVSEIENHPQTPDWARTLSRPMKNGHVRVKVGKYTPVTLRANGKVIGKGSLADIVPGSKVVAAIRFENPWQLTGREGDQLKGIALGCDGLLVEKPAPRQKIQWGV
jgi:hypothetical protein